MKVVCFLGFGILYFKFWVLKLRGVLCNSNDFCFSLTVLTIITIIIFAVCYLAPNILIITCLCKLVFHQEWCSVSHSYLYVELFSHILNVFYYDFCDQINYFICALSFSFSLVLVNLRLVSLVLSRNCWMNYACSIIFGGF